MNDFWGKNISLSPKSYEYKLSKDNKTKLVSLDSSESHSNNEKTKLEIKESWDKSVLSLEWVISVYYNWKNLSLVSHAALAMLENEKININQSDLNIDTSFKSEQNFFSTKIKAGSTEKVSLKPLFDEARNLYKKSVSQGWTEMYIVQTLYARTGAVNGIFLAGYAHFVLIYLQALMEDINIVLQTGVQGSAEINFLYSKTNALMVYYTDLTGKRIDLGNLDGFPTSSPGLVWSGVDNYLMTTMYKTETN